MPPGRLVLYDYTSNGDNVIFNPNSLHEIFAISERLVRCDFGFAAAARTHLRRPLPAGLKSRMPPTSFPGRSTSRSPARTAPRSSPSRRQPGPYIPIFPPKPHASSIAQSRSTRSGRSTKSSRTASLTRSSSPKPMGSSKRRANTSRPALPLAPSRRARRLLETGHPGQGAKEETTPRTDCCRERLAIRRVRASRAHPRRLAVRPAAR